MSKTWGELQDHAENDQAGEDLLPWVELVDDLGTDDAVLEAVDRLGAENACDGRVATLHKAEGREWSSVRIGEDFAEPEPDAFGRPGPISTGEARLAYVAVTVARRHLDVGGPGNLDQLRSRGVVEGVGDVAGDRGTDSPSPRACFRPGWGKAARAEST
ncbi:hypothetical protein [Streptomyces griseocarneus]|uniref:hypothetical protein n=1 Tax=Streptomyces griseocarneus TaxID=51201 RepID=UPI00167E1E5F|nr:hypothetical protein [Streptomyces griseocarneus]MBZ6475033.1 hypothetical protein [Streptomyces griseocarneus]